MLYFSLDRIPKACASESFLGRCSAFLFLVLSIALSSACGGHSSISNPLPNSGTAANLNIAAALPSGTVGANYNAALAVTGGTAPYTFAVVTGKLPDGVGLDEKAGTISGTPSSAGSFSFTVSALDAKGNSKQKPLQISVADNSTSASGGSGGSGSSGSGSTSGGSGSGSNGPSSGANTNGGKSFPNVQKVGGWGQFGQGPPDFVDCSPSPCNGISFGMAQGVSNPSQSGSATEFDLGGSNPYSDGLWNNHLIGPLSSQGTFDSDGSLTPSIYNFTLDVDFYGDNLGLSQALEFDINQFFGGMGFIFGHECRIAAGNQWDVFDNQAGKWVPTGVPCNPNSNAWNHVTLKMQRTSDNHMTYQSITLNDQTTTLNWTFQHGSAPNWYGVTVNYQMDGNFKQDTYSTYIDNFTITYQ
jgi:Putative Ig domain